ncbi:phage tail protein [Burkholderia pyrrocinia]
MANLKEESKWEEGVYQFETSDPVEGGPDGVDNVPTKQLANRTRHLKDRADANDKRAADNDTRVGDLGKRVDALGNDKFSVAGGVLKGALLAKPGAIAGNNPKNVGIAFDGDPDTGMFSPADGHLQLGANGVPYVAMQGDVMSLAAPGVLLFNSGGVERARLTPDGRLLIGTATDNGRDGMQVAYRASFSQGVRSSGMDLGGSGGQYRAAGIDYGVMLRNDDRTFYLLQTNKGDPYGAWNDFRPLSWDLESGLVRLDDSGRGTRLGGAVEVVGDVAIKRGGEGRVFAGQNDGYFYGNAETAGWYSPTKGAFQYFFGNRTFRIDGQPVWHSGNLTPLDLNLGGTLKGGLWLAAGARIFLSEGTPQNPSLTFDKDGAPDTGFYHIADGDFGVTCNGLVNVRFTANKGTIFDRAVQVPTPAAGDRSSNAASTAFVVDAIASASIGQIIFEARTAPRAGCLTLNGTLLNRADYPGLWAYAQGSGALVEEKDWVNGNFGSFSNGDGATTFRIPEFRGEGIRCADAGRGADPGRRVGTWQDSQNRVHAHGASAGAVGDHSHGAWTDLQGHHGHGVNDPGHAHTTRIGRVGVVGTSYGQGTGPYNWDQGDNFGSSGSGTGISINGDGAHGHNVGIGGAGGHSHPISVAVDGGAEARMRNIAVLAMIRAF